MSEPSTIAQFMPVKRLTIPAKVRSKTGPDKARDSYAVSKRAKPQFRLSSLLAQLFSQV